MIYNYIKSIYGSIFRATFFGVKVQMIKDTINNHSVTSIVNLLIITILLYYRYIRIFPDSFDLGSLKYNLLLISIADVNAESSNLNKR